MVGVPIQSSENIYLTLLYGTLITLFPRANILQDGVFHQHPIVPSV